MIANEQQRTMYELANHTDVLSDKERIYRKSNILIITSHIYHGGGRRQNPTEEAFLLASALAASQNSQAINNENLSMKKVRSGTHLGSPTF